MLPAAFQKKKARVRGFSIVIVFAAGQYSPPDAGHFGRNSGMNRSPFVTKMLLWKNKTGNATKPVFFAETGRSKIFNKRVQDVQRLLT